MTAPPSPLATILDEIEARAKAATHEATAIYCDGKYGFKTNNDFPFTEPFVAVPLRVYAAAAIPRLVAALRLALESVRFHDVELGLGREDRIARVLRGEEK